MKRALLICALALAGCATKHYGRQISVTDYERSNLTCREIDIEIAKTKGFIEQTGKEAQFSGRDVLAVLGDFGIGNRNELRDAMNSANVRLSQLNSMHTTKQCDKLTPPPPA